MIRVLVADDSSTARELLVAILNSDTEMQVIGEAKNGVEAVEMTRQLRPDVVTMDLRMPRMDGLEATKEIMITVPTPIVIISGSISSADVEASMHVLKAGALAVFPKPQGPVTPGFEEEAQQLITSVKAMSQVKVVRHWRTAAAATPPPRQPVSAQDVKKRVVAIATSTGGPAALHRLFSDLPGSFAAPILVVQHISTGFTQGLTEWLNKVSSLHVKIAEAGEPLQPHTAYFAPDGQHLGVSRQGAVALSSAAPVGGFRPSGTYLFESVAESFGAGALALILTGMGEDGVEGLRAVRQAGGTILAQDKESCVIFGMPGAAVAAGLTDLVLPLEKMPARLLELVGV